MIKFLIDNDMFDGDQMTVTGKTHNENLQDLNHPGLTPGQEIIRPLSDPIKATGHLQIMYGNLCPGGGVAKSEYEGASQVENDFIHNLNLFAFFP